MPQSPPAASSVSREQAHTPVKPATACNIAGPPVRRKCAGLPVFQLLSRAQSAKSERFREESSPARFQAGEATLRRRAGLWRFPAHQSVARTLNPVQSKKQKIAEMFNVQRSRRRMKFVAKRWRYLRAAASSISLRHSLSSFSAACSLCNVSRGSAVPNPGIRRSAPASIFGRPISPDVTNACLAS